MVQRYVIRNANTQDLAKLETVATVPGMYNLPSQKDRLKILLDRTQGSFEGRIKDPFERAYVFVMEDLEKDILVGTSQVIAQHGTAKNPHIYMERLVEEYYSASIDTLCRQETLHLGFEHDGPTELGGLVISEAYRKVPEKLGRQLSYVRLMFIGMFKKLFRKQLIAEMLPPICANGRNAFWDSIAGCFIPLSYDEADELTRKDKEFVKTLMPRGPFYVGLLSEKGRQSIGAVAPGARAAYKLLVSLGFKERGKVDPFDGGPYLEASLEDVELIQNVAPWTLLPIEGNVAPQGPSQLAMWTTLHSPFASGASFKAIQSGFWAGPRTNTAWVSADVIETLGVTDVWGLVFAG